MAWSSDLTYALRQLARAPGFALAAMVTLGLGVGVTTAVFTVASAVLVRPLPFPNADRLVRIVDEPSTDGTGSYRRAPSTVEPEEFAELRARAEVLAQVGTYVGASATLTGRGEATALTVTRMSAAFFPMLGERPMLGRGFEEGEEAGALPTVVVLSHGAWQRWFGGSVSVLGQSIQLDGRPVTIVGVMPASFAFPDAHTDAWQPFRPTRVPGRSQRFMVYAAVSPGTQLRAASAQVSAILQELRGFPSADEYQAAGQSLPFGLVSLKDHLVEPVRPAVRLLAIAASTVLLLACVNVATLLLARGAGRQRELATRFAIGASRGRIVGQLFTESLLLAALSGAVGLALASAFVRVLTTLGTALMRRDLGPGVSLPRLSEVQIDVTTLAIVAGLVILSSVIAGVWPALRLGWFASASSLGDYRPDTGGTRRLIALGPLVVAQVALAVTLLVGSTLLIRSFANLMRVNLGFEAANVLTFRVSFPAGRYSREALEGFSSQVVERIGAVPGVVATSYTHFLPFVQYRAGGRVATRPKPAEDLRDSAVRSPERPNHMWVHQDFFRTLGVRISEGRGFTTHDDASRPGVAVVNAALVRSGLLGSAPVGQVVYFGTTPKPWEVVGVVDDFIQFGFGTPTEPEIYTDVRQRPALPGPPGIGPYILVRTAVPPLNVLAAVRSAVSAVDRDAAVISVATMDDIVGNARSRPRLYTALMSLFAASALVIAAASIFGVIAYVVALRRREIGIRMSLGATPGRVVSEFVMQASGRTALGLLIGLGTAAGLVRYLESMLFGVSATDPWSFAAAASLLAIVATAAAFLPAWRAAAVDPVEVLRAE